MTIAEIEAATGISRKLLHQIENRTRCPSPEQVALLAQALSINLKDI